MSRFGGDAFFVYWSGRSAIGNTTTGNTVNVRANAAAVTGGRSMGAASNNIEPRQCHGRLRTRRPRQE
ncbi:hypothetical protein [uncultured Selenomonas sp.]|uniref:hypothetical protein n=1 Tax=uncultured Selenomonas sp. TaxID=159275 RepID=UPI0028E8B874|nr:hypothetical protein [uncultured Selenomonas sp.]